MVLLHHWADSRLLLSIDLLGSMQVLALGQRGQVNVAGTPFFATHHDHRIDVVSVIRFGRNFGVVT